MTCLHEEDQLASPYERSRQAVVEHYTTGTGAEWTDIFAMLFTVRENPGLDINGLSRTRSNYRAARGTGLQPQIRKRVINALDKAQRHKLVEKSAGGYQLTCKGKQFVLGGVHSRATTHKAGRVDIAVACALCAEDELPPQQQLGEPVEIERPAPIGQDLSRCMAVWNRGFSNSGYASVF